MKNKTLPQFPKGIPKSINERRLPPLNGMTAKTARRIPIIPSPAIIPEQYKTPLSTQSRFFSGLSLKKNFSVIQRIIPPI